MLGNSNRNGSRRGITVVEVLLVVVFVSVIGIVTWRFLIQGTRGSVKLTAKLDLQRRARMASLRITREIQQGVEVLHPRLGESRTTPIIVFLNAVHELIVLYVDERSRLVRLNRSKGDEETVLAENVQRLRAFRKGRRLLNYHIFLEADEAQGRKQRFNLISGATLRNNFN